MPAVTIRYWAAAREAAGVASETVEAGSVAEALERAGESHPGPAFARVLAASSVLCAGRVVHAEQRPLPLDGATELEVLPPFAGG